MDMADENLNDIVTETTGGDGAPIAGDAPRRRRRRVATVLAGAVGGYVVGAAAVLIDSQRRYTGDPSHSATWLIGLPLLLAIVGTVAAVLLDATRDVEDVDAPVRLRRFRRQGRAAASTRGQTPGSDVPPRYDPEAEHRGPPHSAGLR